MLKNISIDLTYQPFIDKPPLNPDQLHGKACQADGATIDHWRETWVKNIQANSDAFNVLEGSLAKLWNVNKYKPAIILGSGPSLKDAIPGLKLNQSLDDPLLTISCLHNIGYMKDEGIDVDYYVSLDAGDIVLKDMFEGRERDDYFEGTENDTLLAYLGSPPELLRRWKGKIYFFNTLIPDADLRAQMHEICPLNVYVSTGGNALGGGTYIAKAILGSPSIMLCGADFCFSYDNQFHAYKTSYDNLGGYVMHPDVFGIPRKTWLSYLNFKYWFDKISMTVPGEWISCSFGTMGAYLGGNLKSFKYMPLEEALIPYKITERVELVASNGEKSKLSLKEMFQDANFSQKVTLF